MSFMEQVVTLRGNYNNRELVVDVFTPDEDGDVCNLSIETDDHEQLDIYLDAKAARKLRKVLKPVAEKRREKPSDPVYDGHVSPRA